MTNTWTVKDNSVLFTQPIAAGTRISVTYQY